MNPIAYTLDGIHAIVLTAETELAYDADPEVRAHVERVAQERADGTGRACEVFRSNGADLLLQKDPA